MIEVTVTSCSADKLSQLKSSRTEVLYLPDWVTLSFCPFSPGISAPFVEESKVQYVLKLEEVIPIKLNGTFLVVGSLQQVFIPAEIMDEDGYLSIEKANSLCSLGINGYYETKLLEKLPYAKA